MAAEGARSKLDRRKFLKRGLLGGGLLVLAGTLPFAFRTTALGRRPRRDLRLRERAHAVAQHPDVLAEIEVDRGNVDHVATPGRS